MIVPDVRDATFQSISLQYYLMLQSNGSLKTLYYFLSWTYLNLYKSYGRRKTLVEIFVREVYYSCNEGLYGD